MEKGTCKHFNGTHHNTHCKAGVLYRDVTTEPDRLEGSLLRIPCLRLHEKWVDRDSRVLSPSQQEEYSKRGSCEKYEEPTDEEIKDFEIKMEARIKEVVESLNRGVVPPGVLACGPSNKTCLCDCPTSCEHKWDGPLMRDEDPDSEEALGAEYVPSQVFTKTCSRCGTSAFSHDMWVGE